MAEETRYYGARQTPQARPAGAPLGLAETEIAPTLAVSRPAEAEKAQAVADPVIAQAVPVDLAPGTEAGEYRVVRKLGEGGMGAVYAGEQPAIGKRVAIKVLAAHCAANPELVRRFLDEARAVNLIHHRHIIDIFSFGELPGPRPYFVMEYLDGESLADAIEYEHLRPDEIRRLLRQICSALDATHRMDVVHRDLKPENIWIARPPHGESYAKLLDFGIAKLVDPTRTNLTQTGTVMGTPLCMSPEQCLGRAVDARADIYAMGVLLYRIFAGRFPFMGSLTTELAVKHVTEPPPPPSRFAPLPAALERLILDCLAKDPQARPASAQVLGAKIEAELAAWPEHRMAATRQGAAKGEAASVGTPQLTLRDERTFPASRRPSVRGHWLLLGVGLAVAGAVVGAWLLRRGPEAAPVAPPAATVRHAPEAKTTPPSVTVVAPREPALQGEATVGATPTPRIGGKPHAVHAGRKAAVVLRPTPTSGLPAEPAVRPAATKVESAAMPPPREPAAAASPAPAPRPTRAQERGLLDENPLRR